MAAFTSNAIRTVLGRVEEKLGSFLPKQYKKRKFQFQFQFFIQS